VHFTGHYRWRPDFSRVRTRSRKGKSRTRPRQMPAHDPSKYRVDRLDEANTRANAMVRGAPAGTQQSIKRWLAELTTKWLTREPTAASTSSPSQSGREQRTGIATLAHSSGPRPPARSSNTSQTILGKFLPQDSRKEAGSHADRLLSDPRKGEGTESPPP